MVPSRDPLERLSVGIAIVGLATIIGCIRVPDLSGWLIAALACSAFALPTAAGAWIILQLAGRRSEGIIDQESRRLLVALVVVGALASIVGLGLTLASFQQWLWAIFALGAAGPTYLSIRIDQSRGRADAGSVGGPG